MTQDTSEGDENALHAFCGPLQRVILAELFEADTSIPAREVRDRLDEEGTDRAQSTISTELKRLHDKGIVERERDEYPGGFRYLYAPVEDFQERYLETHLDAIHDVLGDDSLLTLCDLVRLRAREEDTSLTGELTCE